ncbi:MAG: PAS domain-containing protein, partial [Xanthobacteraceae bacterium]
MEGFGVGTWDLDLSTRELEWSDATRSLFGLDRVEPVSYERFLSLLEPGDRERTDRAIWKVAETGGSLDVSFKLRSRHKSGQWIRARGGLV